MLGGRRTRYFARPVAAEVQNLPWCNNGTHLMRAAAGLRPPPQERVQHQPPKQDCERYARNSVCLVSALTAALPIAAGYLRPSWPSSNHSTFDYISANSEIWLIANRRNPSSKWSSQRICSLRWE